MEELKNDEKVSSKKSSIGIIIILIMVCVALLAVICVKQMSAKSHILYVYVANDYSYDTISDKTQMNNALAKGGKIVIKADSDFIDNVVPEARNYGASDSKGSYYIYGAIINYISNSGWTLVSTTNDHELYFVK